MASFLDLSTWSVLSLPPLPSDSKPLYPSVTALYSDVLSHPLFPQLFGFGLVFWYFLSIIATYIFTQWVPLETKQKMQKEQFAGHVTSYFHALMISGASSLMLWRYTPFSALSADPNEPMMRFYKYCTVFSVAYFFLDTIFISMYYKQPISKKLGFVVHHFLSGLCMMSVLVTAPICTYITAMNFMIEWSTVILDIRIFARIWNFEWVYFFSGIGLLISYPFTRIIWNAYLILIAFTSPYPDYGTTTGGGLILGIAGCFVALLSSFYFFTVILKKPSKIYILGPKAKHC